MRFVIPILQILIVFQCLIFLLYLFVDSRWRQTPNRILTALLITLSAHMLFNLVNQYLVRGLFWDVVIGFGFFYGPLIFLYVHALSIREFALRAIHGAHFFPGLAASASATVLGIPAYLYAIGIFISLFVYATASYRHLAYYRRVLGQTHAEGDRIALRWLSSILAFQIIVLIANVASVALSYSGQRAAGQWAEISLFVFLVALVGTITVKGLRHPTLFPGITEEDRAVAEMHRTAPTLDLPEPEANALLLSLQEQMATEQPFLDPSISIKTLSRQVGALPRDVSRVINRKLQQNFSQFINQYRIEMVKEQLRNPACKDQSIIETMYECGFNTKSNFNRSFKELTGQTPNQYRKNPPKSTQS